MVSRAKNKLQLIDGISQYHKQQQGQIGETNNTGTKSTNHQITYYDKVWTITEELKAKLEAAVTVKKIQ